MSPNYLLCRIFGVTMQLELHFLPDSIDFVYKKGHHQGFNVGF